MKIGEYNYVKYIQVFARFRGSFEDSLEFHFTISEDGMELAKEYYEQHKKQYDCSVKVIEEIDIEHDNPWGNFV